MTEIRRTLSIKITALEEERLKKYLEKYNPMNVTDVLRMGMWKMFDEDDNSNSSDVNMDTIRYEIKNTVEAVLKERGL